MSFKIAETVIVIATGLCLVAHGGNERLCALKDAGSVTFDVTGNCGPPGRVTVSTEDGTCGLTLSGDDVGVPTSGDTDSIRGGGWSTTGPVASRGGESLTCAAHRVNTDDDRRFRMNCVGDGEKKCEAYFIDIAEGCNTTACQVPECASGTKLDLAVGDCCPSCVECPGCVPSPPVTPEPPACEPSECPASCEPDYELTDVGDPCCLRCAPRIDEAQCAAGRSEYTTRFESEQPTWLSCRDDSECLVVSLTSPCANHCRVVVSGPVFGQPWSALLADSMRLCLHCPPQDGGCPGPFPAARCLGGACELVP